MTELTDEQRLIRETARQFAQTEIVPNALEWDRKGQCPMDLFERMGALGLMGVCVEPQFGGAGADFVSYVLAMEEISAGDGGISNLMAHRSARLSRNMGLTNRRLRIFPNCAAVSGWDPFI